MQQYETYMRKCFELAQKGYGKTSPNPMVGCVIINDDGGIISEGFQSECGKAHAERDALLKVSPADCNGATLIVNLEPCSHYGKTPPCAKLLEELKPKRIIIGTNDTHKIASGGAARLKDIEVSLVLSSKAESLLYPFKCLQRGRFNLFKIASRLDGSYEGGIISNEDSRIFTHNMRAVADSITISGRTLRDDNPFLDTRYALPPYKSNKNPKIYIFSKNIKDISSYNIKNREVEIVENLNHLQEGFNIIEGGFSMLSNVKDSIDCIMGYIAPSIRTGGMFHQTSLDDFYLAHCDILEKEEGNIRYWLFRK